MAESQKTVFTNDEVAPQLLDIIQEAEKYVIIVTPYIKLWRHAQAAFSLAVKRKVKVTAVVRCENEILVRSDNEDVTWLQNNGVKVRMAEYLHAKIYLNEHKVLVSSMNLTGFSTTNSLEIALLIQDEEAERQVRGYVTHSLMPLAVPVRGVKPELTHQPAREPRRSDSPAVAGACIRCRLPIALNPSRPLCPGCYEVWNQWGDEDYPEDFCHACGQPSGTAYARPLCQNCYRRYR